MAVETAPEGATRTGAAVDAFTAPVRAIVFDMDGLLLNTEVLAREGLRLAGPEVGIALSEAVCQLMIGVPADACRRLLLEHFGADAPADQLLAAAARQLHRQVDAGLLQTKSGAFELLDYLDRHHIPRALATSSARDKTLRHLGAAGLAGSFSITVTRDDVSRGKPFPDLYQEAASRLGVPPHQCLALEDSYNGVRAAAAAGMPVVMVPDLLPPTPEMRQFCQAILPDLHAVLALLQRQRGFAAMADDSRNRSCVAGTGIA